MPRRARWLGEPNRTTVRRVTPAERMMKATIEYHEAPLRHYEPRPLIEQRMRAAVAEYEAAFREAVAEASART